MRAQARTRLTNELLVRLLDSASDAIVVLDADQRITIFNKGAERIFGYAAEEVVGKPHGVLLPPDVADEHREYVRAFGASQEAARGMAVRREVRAWRKDGTEFPAEASIGVVTENGSPVFTAILRDVSEQRRAAGMSGLLQKTALAVAEAKDTTEALGVFLRQVCDAVGWEYGDTWVLNDKGTALVCGQAWYARVPGLDDFREASLRLFFSLGAGLPGRTWEKREPTWFMDVSSEPAFVRREVAAKVGLRTAVAIPILAGDDVVASAAFYMKDPRQADRDVVDSVRGVVAQLSALFQRKRAEEELAQYREHLEELVEQRTAQLAAANGELEAFAYAVAHDLRAPLRSIDGFSQALVEDLGGRLDAQSLDYLQRVRTASQRMGQLIDDLLKMSRTTRGEMTLGPVSLSGLALAAVEDLRQRDPERWVEVAIEDGLEVKGDARLLEVAVRNLIENAWKFTAGVDRPRVEFGAMEREGRRAYFVRDNGAGFDMAYAGKLFQPFQRLHAMNEFPGSGVGLATVRRIIQRHGGHVWAEGEPGKGATVYFTI